MAFVWSLVGVGGEFIGSRGWGDWESVDPVSDAAWAGRSVVAMQPAVDDETEVGEVAGGLDDGRDLVAE